MAGLEDIPLEVRREKAQRVADDLVQHAKLLVEEFQKSKGSHKDAVDAHCRKLAHDSSKELRDLGDQYLALESTKNLRSELPRSAGGTMKWLNPKESREWLRNYEREHS